MRAAAVETERTGFRRPRDLESGVVSGDEQVATPDDEPEGFRCRRARFVVAGHEAVE